MENIILLFNIFTYTVGSVLIGYVLYVGTQLREMETEIPNSEYLNSGLNSLNNKNEFDVELLFSSGEYKYKS